VDAGSETEGGQAAGRPAWEIAVAAGAELGERPVWDAAGSCLLWVDIKAGRLHRYRPGEGNELVIELAAAGPGEPPVAIGAAAHRRGGGYVLAASDGFRLTGPEGELQDGPARPPGMGDDVRFNDAACDPAGRFWAGTVGYDRRQGAGALYRLDPGGAVTTVLEGVTESNGLGWSPDGATFFYIDSGEPRPRVRAFEFDAATGVLGRSRDLVRFGPGGAVPDGLVVDGDGCVWVALFGGGAVHRYSPDGELLAVHPVPVSQPTCPAFGGPDLSHLYVTTAWEGMDPAQRAAEPLAGHVLRTRPGCRGQAAHPFGG
jgi:sugar lactone lactonase YvrE